jgi:hypothetical protein
VDLSVDLPPPRRPLFFPVVIATVFLSIIGMSAGLVLGSRHSDRQTAAPQQQPQYTTPAGTPTPTAKPCRPETQEMARKYGASGTLRIELLLRTTRSAVWICADDAGHLYYHANKGGEDARWIENETALFMTGVQRNGDGYLVQAEDATTFSIDSRRLRIVHKDGKVEVQTAVN